MDLEVIFSHKAEHELQLRQNIIFKMSNRHLVIIKVYRYIGAIAQVVMITNFYSSIQRGKDVDLTSSLVFDKQCS